MNLQSLINCWSSVRECLTITIFSKSSNSLVLHRASPFVRNIPTWKMGKNLTCHLTRGRRVAFCKPEDFCPAMTTVARKKCKVSLNSAQSFRENRSFEAEILCLLANKQARWPSLFTAVFYPRYLQENNMLTKTKSRY